MKKLIILGVICFLGCFNPKRMWHASFVYYVEEAGLYVKIKRDVPNAKIYFSTNLEFDSDYIEFCNHSLPAIQFYYLPPNNVHFVNLYIDEDDILQIQQQRFQITFVKQKECPIHSDSWLCLSDSSFLEKPNYTFRTDDNAIGIYGWDPDGNELRIKRIK